MSYSDDAVKAKLNSLNETQDSIVTVAQWIMFHRRHADRTASLWLGRLQESNMSKRLNLIYLANEVVQQSRARSKTDFLVAFEPLIADATAAAYKGATQEVQGKLRRVVEVWRQRSIFDPRIQEQIEKRIDEIDKQKGGKSLSGGGGRLGGSLFGGSGGSVTPELDTVNKAQIVLNKAEAATKTPLNTANAQYAKMTDPNTPVPSAPVRAAKLGQLVKDLRAASGAVDASIKSRRELLAGLEKLLENNRTKLAEEEAASVKIIAQIEDMSETVREVEDSIMRGQDVSQADSASNGEDWGTQETARPETERFTPPPPDVESFTPPSQDDHVTTSDPNASGLLDDQGYASTTGAEPISEQSVNFNEPPPAFVPPSALPDQSQTADTQELLRTLMSVGQVRQASGEVPSASAGGNSGDPRLKRRKVNHSAGNDIDDEIFGSGNVGGVDEAGISAMLSQS